MKKGSPPNVCAKDADAVMMFLDISRAHPYVEVKQGRSAPNRHGKIALADIDDDVLQSSFHGI